MFTLAVNQNAAQPQPDAAKALCTQFNRTSNSGIQCEGHRGGRDKFNGEFEGRNHGGFRSGGKGKFEKRADFDPDKFCTRHNVQGQDINNCQRSRRKEETTVVMHLDSQVRM